MKSPIFNNLEIIRNRIAEAALRSGRVSRDIQLIAVSKTVPVERIREAVEAGITLFGENRVQEAKEKFKNLEGLAHFHLIGHLQTNKVKEAIRISKRIHSLDSLRLAQEIDRRCGALGKIMPVLLQVNVASEETKYGATVEDTALLVKEIRKLDNIRLDGLMTIPPYALDPEDSRLYFRQLAQLRDDLESQELGPLPELSMGMSGDFPIAIEEGATFVRVGSALFGARL